jgi:hypothetical protein
MAFDPLAIVVLVVAAGLGSAAGYWGRITQKLEERRDDIYLKNLPGIYASTEAFTGSMDLFVKGGSVKQLGGGLEKINENLKGKIFSADIIIFKEDLYDSLRTFSQDLDDLDAALTAIQTTEQGERENREQQFRNALREGVPFADGEDKVSPKQVLDEGKGLNSAIRSELKRYKSYSWRLMLAIFITGAGVAALDLVKSYFSG